MIIFFNNRKIFKNIFKNIFFAKTLIINKYSSMLKVITKK